MSWTEVAKQANVRRKAQLPAEWLLSQQQIDSVSDFDLIQFVNTRAGLSQRELEITNAISVTELARVRQNQICYSWISDCFGRCDKPASGFTNPTSFNNSKLPLKSTRHWK